MLLSTDRSPPLQKTPDRFEKMIQIGKRALKLRICNFETQQRCTRMVCHPIPPDATPAAPGATAMSERGQAAGAGSGRARGTWVAKRNPLTHHRWYCTKHFPKLLNQTTKLDLIVGTCICCRAFPPWRAPPATSPGPTWRRCWCPARRRMVFPKSALGLAWLACTVHACGRLYV